MDEPLGALDRELRLRMTVELRRIDSQLGTTFVYVTHDRDEALSMSDRVALMHDGVIEGVGTPHSLFTQPASRFVASFFGSHNILPATVSSGIAADPPPGQGRPTKVRCLGQVVEVNSWSELAPGGDALVAVPTEALRMTETAEPSLVVEGHVDQLIYLGQHQELFFTTEAGSDMIAHLALVNTVPKERGNWFACTLKRHAGGGAAGLKPCSWPSAGRRVLAAEFRPPGSGRGEAVVGRPGMIVWVGPR